MRRILSPLIGVTSGIDALTATDSSSLSDVSAPAIGQTHALTSTDAESAADVSAPVISEIYNLLSTDAESASDVTSPALGYVFEGWPTSDVAAGAWLPSAGGDLYAMLDEEPASDADWIYTTTASTFEVGLSPVQDPVSSSGHILKYRLYGDDVSNIQITLKQTGVGTIAQWTETSVASGWADYQHTLTGVQADSITDYTALSVEGAIV